MCPTPPLHHVFATLFLTRRAPPCPRCPSGKTLSWQTDSNSQHFQAALARYRRKKKRRHLVPAMRENDPNRKEQNKARERPRNKGKFNKKGPDFVSITDVQKRGNSRSSSGELPARATTPPPPAGQDRRSVRAKLSQDAPGVKDGSRS